MRPLPANRETEAAVLGAIMLRNDAINEVVTVVIEDDFHFPAHRAVFRAMCKLADRGEPIDVHTLETQLAVNQELKLVGGLEGLGKLSTRHASTYNVATHAEIIRQLSTLRQMIATSQEITDGAYSPVEDVAAFIDDAERRVLEVGQRGRNDAYESVADNIAGVFENIVERIKRKDPITGVATQFVGIDELTGGLQPSDLIIVAARPSMGKTALALNIAQAACITQLKHARLAPEERPVRHPVLFFTAEMSKQQLIERMIFSEARVDVARMRTGSILENELKTLVAAADRIHRAPLAINDASSPSILEIRSFARRFRRDAKYFSDTREQIGLIVVDYLQLCRGGKSKYDVREQEISEVSRGLKAIAKELKIPVLALSQLNRGVDSRSDHRPQLSDLRESGAIEQDADVIMFIYRDEIYERDEEKRSKIAGQAEVIVGKQRNGPTGTVHLTFAGKYTRFENAAKEWVP
jgi:replicative DNA helicase